MRKLKIKYNRVDLNSGLSLGNPEIEEIVPRACDELHGTPDAPCISLGHESLILATGATECYDIAELVTDKTDAEVLDMLKAMKIQVVSKESKCKMIIAGLIQVNDPESNLPVEMEVYKETGGGMFAVDASYLEQDVGDTFSPFNGRRFDGEQASLSSRGTGAIHLGGKESSMILAALRLAQKTMNFDQDIASNSGEHKLMSSAEIDELCERINFS